MNYCSINEAWGQANYISKQFNKVNNNSEKVIRNKKKHIEKFTNSNKVNKIYIMTSDMDYLQLASDKILIYNMQYIQLITSKNSTGNAAKDLFCKIVIGDKSDNIPSVFKKCSLKNAIEYFNLSKKNDLKK